MGGDSEQRRGQLRQMSIPALPEPQFLNKEMPYLPQPSPAAPLTKPFASQLFSKIDRTNSITYSQSSIRPSNPQAILNAEVVSMSSRQSTEQARRNGALAAGTKSPEGVKKSSMNALRHGLTAKSLVLATESQEQFDELLKNYVEFYDPNNTIELDLVHDMVAARWRLSAAAPWRPSP